MAKEKHRQTCLLLVLIILAVGTGIWQSRVAGGKKRALIEEAIIVVFRPAQSWFSAAGETVANLFAGFQQSRKLATEKRRLEAEVDRLKARNSRLQEAYLENVRLRQLLDLRANLPHKTITATIIGSGPSDWLASVLLDKGRADGVPPKSPVVSGAGMVGQVYTVTAHTANVLLIVDRNSGVGGMIQRSRETGILKGTGRGDCTMEYMRAAADVRPGDQVISSGLGSIFPKGLLIGTVTSVKRDDYNTTTSVEIDPAVDFNRLEEVLVIVK